MHIIDFYPSRGHFVIGEPISLLIEIESDQKLKATTRVSIRHLADDIQLIEQSQNLVADFQTVCINWMPPSNPAGYAASVELISDDGAKVTRASTAFAVVRK